ncbi:THAP domain-containing protein 1-like isoform X2 [Vanessa cardui]|uniref:THAP domain-containing protein 1-like isoform X2 n=1 Tax=Vanessa cardui TaxID=171605 RepID=UPI001F1457D2|nr:THAP domain-containing protein 1-like isoform X2 [Vanessa cardui]
MPYCSILECRNDSRRKNLKNGGTSYHRFPNDPSIKEMWIVATGRINWMPSKFSTICSKHFLKDDFLMSNKGLRYTKPTAFPSIKTVKFYNQVPQVSSDDNKCEQSIGEANEKLTEPLDPQSRLNDPKSTINDLDVSTQSTSKETLPRKVLPLRSTRKSSKHSPISTKESLCQKTERENDYISTTLQRLENISKGLNTTQQQLAQHTQDEFYFFALSVAAQLRILPLPIALETQSKIQNTLSAARLFLKPSPSSSNCNSPIYDQSANSLKTQDTGELVSFIKIEENALPLEQFEELM